MIEGAAHVVAGIIIADPSLHRCRALVAPRTNRDVCSYTAEVVFLVTIRQAVDVDGGTTEADEIDDSRHNASIANRAGGSVELRGRIRKGLGLTPGDPT
jgi:hypothetical protein